MKDSPRFECVECGYVSLKYYGKCPRCSSWNSMVESTLPAAPGDSPREGVKARRLKDIEEENLKRIPTGQKEFNRVLGGGIVRGSIVLIGGEPGIGKSTLLLESARELGTGDRKVLYFSGEESFSQIRMRSRRLKVDSDNLYLLAMGSLEDITAACDEIQPDYLVVDSIQTLTSTAIQGMAGSVSFLKHLTGELIQLAKRRDITVFIIGHITKDGRIAGPKSLEHMVDVVLYFESEMQSDLRLLRAQKNRFGPVNELGIFQMTSQGLCSLDDPRVFVRRNREKQSGISIYPSMNGLRSILIEIQVLVTETPFTGNPRRIAVGVDHHRLSMLISVIEKKLKLPFYKSDVFVNITGGFNLKDTSGDLGMVTSLISSHRNLNLPPDLVVIGEVGLTGEIRPASFFPRRFQEGRRQGFTHFIIPHSQREEARDAREKVYPVKNIRRLMDVIREMA